MESVHRTRSDKAAYFKGWKAANKDKVANYDRRYRERHPEVGRAAALRFKQRNLEKVRHEDMLRQRERRAADPEGQRRRRLAYKLRLEAQRVAIAGRPHAERCEICASETTTLFDHCHTTGAFRGWICDRCNKVLGLVYDDPALLRQLAGYLEANVGDKTLNRQGPATHQAV